MVVRPVVSRVPLAVLDVGYGQEPAVPGPGGGRQIALFVQGRPFPVRLLLFGGPRRFDGFTVAVEQLELCGSSGRGGGGRLIAVAATAVRPLLLAAAAAAAVGFGNDLR